MLKRFLVLFSPFFLSFLFFLLLLFFLFFFYFYQELTVFVLTNAAVRPFLLAVVVLGAAWTAIRRLWAENTLTDLSQTPLAGAGPGPTLARNMPRVDCFGSLRPVVRNRKIWMLSLVQAFFESSIHLFVFSWTPALVRRVFCKTALSSA